MSRLLEFIFTVAPDLDLRWRVDRRVERVHPGTAPVLLTEDVRCSARSGRAKPARRGRSLGGARMRPVERTVINPVADCLYN